MRALFFGIVANLVIAANLNAQTQAPPNNPLAYPSTFQIASASSAAYLLREDDKMLMYCHLDNLVVGVTLPAKCVTPFRLPKEDGGQIVEYRISADDSTGSILKVISSMGKFRLCQGTTQAVVCGPEIPVSPF